MKNLREPKTPGAAGYLPAEEANRLLNMDLFPAGSTVSPAQLSLAKTRFTVENRPAVQSENAARQYADKAKQADEMLSGLQRGGFDPASVGTGVQSLLPNIAKSGNVQQSEQALRQFVNAILRRESGAAISASELSNYRKQYWPEAGDSSQVVQQKAESRRLAVAGLATEGSRVPSQLSRAGSAAGAEIRKQARVNGQLKTAIYNQQGKFLRYE